MLFISCKKLFPFSRYLSFCLNFGDVTKQLDKKDKVNFTFYDVTALLAGNPTIHIAQ